MRKAPLAYAYVFVLVSSLWFACSREENLHLSEATESSDSKASTEGPVTVPAPGLESRDYIAPLEDSYSRLDPTRDGWETEAFTEAANLQLKAFAHALETPSISTEEVSAFASNDFSSPPLRPALSDHFSDDSFSVWRGAITLDNTPIFQGVGGLVEAIRDFQGAFGAGESLHTKMKLYRVEPLDVGLTQATVLFQGSGKTSSGPRQVSATLETDWVQTDALPLLKSIRLLDYEEVLLKQPSPLFADATEAVLGSADSYRHQLLYGTDHWRSRLPQALGLDVVANHGMALGDVNGDGLEDLYVCQQGGLPNRLYLRQADGSLADATEGSGVDWLDYCSSALIIDMDNDGDRDLVVAQEWRTLFHSNDGSGKFQLEFGISSRAQSFSLASADYDEDGDLDVYLCGYNPSVSNIRQGAMGEPIPYHDAQNGGQNILFRNEGNWLFEEVTNEVGLGENNNRFSFAAVWEDFDNDGDLDLYVANDYGRNNLYEYTDGRFKDVASERGLEDMSAGMSASWGDYNRDGRMDLYVSNMFSAAGNRITYQRQFKTGIQDEVKEQFQRHARGNSLFENEGSGPFKDVSVDAGVTMGRWAWGSRFVDLNNDGWEDIVVANGFITAPDTDDL